MESKTTGGADKPTISVTLERNTKGFNYTIHISNAPDADAWEDMLDDSLKRIQKIIAREMGQVSV